MSWPPLAFEAQKSGNTSYFQQRVETSKLYNDTANLLDQQTTLVSLFCGKQASAALTKFSSHTRTLAAKVLADNFRAFNNIELITEMEALMNALRSEIGIP